MKILHIASGDLWAGAEKQIYTLCKELAKDEKNTVIVVIFNEGELSKKLQNKHIITYVLDESKTGSFQIFRALLKILKENNPDIIHTHRSKENIIGGIGGALLNIPSIRTQHGAKEFLSTKMRSQILDRIDRFVGNFLQKKIIAVSKDLEQSLEPKFKEIVCTIDNGILITNPPPSIGTIDKKTWQVGMACRLVHLKRVDIFLAASKIVLDHGNNIIFKFSIFGDGPERKNLEKLARSLGVTDSVTFRGHVNNAEHEISNLDFLVICSDHEGLPMAALEAMASGKIVISHSVGGLTKLLSDNCGILVEEQTPKAFAEAIFAATKNENLSKIREKSYLKASTIYSSKNMAKNYMQCYYDHIGASNE